MMGLKLNLKDQESVFIFDEDGLFVGQVMLDSPGYEGRTTLALNFPVEFTLVRGVNLNEENKEAIAYAEESMGHG